MDAQALKNFLDRNGEDVILRRLTGRGFYIDVTVRARINDYRPEEMAGGIVQGDQKCIISNTEITAAQWPGPPRVGDVIIRNGGTLSAMVKSAASSTLDSEV